MSLSQIMEELRKLTAKVDALHQMAEKPDDKDRLEAVAAKIIEDVKAEINRCPCNDKILDAIKNQPSTSGTKDDNGKEKEDNDGPPKNDDGSKLKNPFGKYSPPSPFAGNPGLGEGMDPNPIRFSFGNTLSKNQ